MTFKNGRKAMKQQALSTCDICNTTEHYIFKNGVALLICENCGCASRKSTLIKKNKQT